MNTWDILDNVEVFDIKLGKAIKRIVLVCMLLIPTFGAWMIGQALNRENATAQTIGTIIATRLADSINKSLQTGSAPGAAPAAPVANVLYPSNYKGPDMYGVPQNK